jgi:hypothetical protein
VRGEQRGEKEDAPAPIAAAAAAGRPRARGIRALCEIGLAPALFAEGGRARALCGTGRGGGENVIGLRRLSRWRGKVAG